MTADNPRLRFAVVGIVAMSLFCALFARLWFLQVMNAPSYAEASADQAIRVVQTEAPRGEIYDRDGDKLVGNRRTIAVRVNLRTFEGLSDVAFCEEDRLGPEQSQVLRNLAQALTRDQAAQANGELVANDPGPLGGDADDGQGGTGADGAAGDDDTNTPGADGASQAPTGDQLGASSDPGEVGRLPGSVGPGGTDDAVTVESLVGRLCDQRFSRFKPVPVATDVSEQLEVFLTEHADEFPAVAVERIRVRDYRYGALAAHILGYVGAINEDEIAELQNPDKPYELDDQVGKAGIEAMMEDQLRGVPGEVRYEVDARNRPVRRISKRAPQAGNDVFLTIDIDLQYIAEQALAAQLDECILAGCTQRTGSAAMVDPRNGQVLAMASYPTYDPRQFVGGISSDEFAALCPACVNPDVEADSEAANGNPLTNKAIAGQYAAGSTWKLFSAWAGLDYGVITPRTQVNDTGSYTVQECQGDSCVFNAPSATGRVALREAITRSSDVYFYKLGDDLWRKREEVGEDAFARAFREWHLGEKTGLGLPSEAEGRVPYPAQKLELARALCEGEPDPEACAQRRGSWYVGDNVITAIGQGDVLVTPLQLANGYATFANGGTNYATNMVLQVNEAFSANAVSVSEPEPRGQVQLPPQWFGPMLEGFKGVTRPGGTAEEAFAGFPNDLFPVAGKTGTAQVDSAPEDTSLFAAFAPADNPRFASAVVLPESGFGSDFAAPMTRVIMQAIADAGGDLAGLPAAPLGGDLDAKPIVEDPSEIPTDEGGD